MFAIFLLHSLMLKPGQTLALSSKRPRQRKPTSFLGLTRFLLKSYFMLLSLHVSTQAFLMRVYHAPFLRINAKNTYFVGLSFKVAVSENRQK